MYHFKFVQVFGHSTSYLYLTIFSELVFRIGSTRGASPIIVKRRYACNVMKMIIELLHIIKKIRDSEMETII